MPRFSVIVPIYNIDRFLTECLSSLENQTFKDFEVICVIDGATDGSAAIAHSFASRDSRFIVHEKANGGLSSARNYGIDQASGDILLFVDGDDFVDPHFCEVIADAMGGSGADALVFGAQVEPEQNSTPWFEEALSPRAEMKSDFDVDFMFAPYTTPFVWRNAVRRDALSASGVRFDETLPFGEDVVFQFALYPRVGTIASIPNKLYHYRVQREGSLMDTRDDVQARLSSHVPLVQRVLASWDELGLLETHRQRIFDWTVPYLLRDVDELSPADEEQHMAQVSALWNRFFGSDTLHPLRLQLLCLCRGEGKTYLLFEVSSFAPFHGLECTASVNGRSLPANAYPLCASDPSDNRWVVETPTVEDAEIELCFVPDEMRFQKADFALKGKKGKWLSRLNYRIKASLCASIRDFERRFTYHQYQCRVSQRFNGNDGAVWRCQAEWIGDPHLPPRLSLLDGKGHPLEAEAILDELQEGDEEGRLPNKATFSLITPEEYDHFILLASDPRGSEAEDALAPGFAVVDAAQTALLKKEAVNLMKCASDDPEGYRRWLSNHQAQPSQLEAQRDEGARILDDRQMLFSIFIDCADGPGENLDRTLESLQAQSFNAWEALVPIEPDSLPPRAKADSRVKAISPEWPLNRPGLLLASAQGTHIAFIQSGDRLEPDALFAFAREVSQAKTGETPEVLYCDEDAFGDNGAPGCPVFKSRLNVDLLYCWNWVGQLTFFDRSIFSESAIAPSFSEPSAWRYSQTLQAYGQNRRFKHIPRVLFHSHVPAAPYATTTLAESDQLQDALRQHLQQRGLPSTVEDGPKPHTMRVRYALPNPRPLVSIVIPNKDHPDLLKACIDSILGKATYDDYEIVIIENNSVQDQTFELYRCLENDPRVRVVTWPDAFNYSLIVNYGAQHARGEYLLLLNNDTEVITPDFIEEMLGYLQRPEVGVVGAKLLYKDGLVQHAGIAVGPWDAVVHVNQFRTTTDGGYLDRACLPGNFTAVTGACQMVRKDLFQELGGYDEAFAVGFNDIDFCMRVLEHGKLVTFAPYAVLYHKEFASRGREEGNPGKMARWESERQRFMACWPKPFAEGDPYTGPNLMRNNTYYRLD